jgi:hypothetical protein
MRVIRLLPRRVSSLDRKPQPTSNPAPPTKRSAVHESGSARSASAAVSALAACSARIEKSGLTRRSQTSKLRKQVGRHLSAAARFQQFDGNLRSVRPASSSGTARHDAAGPIRPRLLLQAGRGATVALRLRARCSFSYLQTSVPLTFSHFFSAAAFDGVGAAGFDTWGTAGLLAVGGTGAFGGEGWCTSS